MSGRQCFDGEAFNAIEDLKPCYDSWNKTYKFIDEGEYKIK
jgi:hypothetical protein